MANWRTTAEKVQMLQNAGFGNIVATQTLTRHPLLSDTVEEQPVEGSDRGDYVALSAVKL